MNARLALFALTLALAAPSATVSAQFVRAPYLQSPTETSIVVAWRSTGSQPSAVCWGTSASSLTNRAGTGASRTDHAVEITGLSPDTQYFYSVAAASCPSGTADPRDSFRTAPRRGSEAPFRMWVVGDSGNASTRQRAVRDEMLAATTDRRPDLFLHMGDMAYDAGTTSEFDARFFAIYADIMRHTPVWPTLGNHEGSNSDSSGQTGPYYEAYVLPIDGRAGGLASGTEAYYAFDWGNVHFIVLDSHDSPRGTAGAMLQWLEEDLAAADAKWIVVYFHHPPYTHGSHNSDNERQLIEMRENALPILEAHGVDLVLGGHSHIYERSHLLRGAYETPTTASGIADPGDGRLDGDGAYRSGTEGTLYVVAGHGGAGVSGTADHPVMFFSERQHGSCVIDVDGDVMTLRNIRWDGEETDHVTLVKRDGLFLASPAGGERYLAGSTVRVAWSSIGAIPSVTIELSLDGGATWSVLAERTENDGVLDWTTPRIVTETARIRVRHADDATLADESADFALASEARVVEIPYGDTWQYSDDGTDHGDAWRMGEGAAWTEGRAQLGYGDGDEATVLREETPNIPTVYFRRSFTLSSDVDFARIRAVYDDGIAVWINGQLVTQANVDGLEHGTFASGASADNATLETELDLTAGNPFVVGENWVAAIVKQSSGTSSDVSFDLELELGLRVTMLDPLDGGVIVSPDGAIIPIDAATTPGTDGGDEPAVEGGCGCRTGARTSTTPLLALLAVGLLFATRRRGEHSC